MKYDVSHALQALKPGAEWTLIGSVYSGLEWLDSGQTKPTETEVTNKAKRVSIFADSLLNILKYLKNVPKKINPIKTIFKPLNR